MFKIVVILPEKNTTIYLKNFFLLDVDLNLYPFIVVRFYVRVDEFTIYDV